MAVSIRSSSKNDSTTGTAISVTAPTGATTGDKVVCLVQANGQTTIVDNTALTISIANLTNGEDSDGNSASTTASVSPSANALELLTVYSRTNITTDPNQPTVTGNGLTWVAIDSVVYDPTSTSRRRITLFRALGASPSSGAITIDFGGQAQTDVGWSLDEATGVDTSGTNGSGAVVQSATNLDSSTTNTSLTVTLAAFSNSNNATFGAFSAGGSEVQTVGSGFTQLSNRILASTNISGLTEWKTTNDTSVDYSVAAGEQMGGIAIEIKAKTIFTQDITDYKPNPTNGHTLSIFSRTIQAGDPSTYNFTSGASGRWSIIAICIQATTPAYDVSPSTANAANDDSASTGTISAPSITTGVNNAIHITFCCWDTAATGGTITIPSGYTLLQTAQGGGEPMSAAYKSIVSAGATGTTQWQNTDFAAMITMSFSVKESASATVNSNFFAFM